MTNEYTPDIITKYVDFFINMRFEGVDREMNFKKILSSVMIFLGLALAVFSVWMCFTNLNAKPVLLSEPEDARIYSEQVMEAVASRDYRAAGAMMYGTPDLGTGRMPETAVGERLWLAFQESLSYVFQGDCYASDAGIARDVTIRALDMDVVLEKLALRTQEAVSERTRSTNDFSLIYDENKNYREDFVMEVLQDTLLQILDEELPYVSSTVTLNLIYRDDQWWVLPDQELIRAISGGIVG